MCDFCEQQFSICLTSLTVPDFFTTDLQEQLKRAAMLDEERRRAESEAARLEAERQAALLDKEELARLADDQLKSKEQLVGILMALFNYFIHICTASTSGTSQVFLPTCKLRLDLHNRS